MFRVPLWPVTMFEARVGSYLAAGIPVLDVHELAAGKLAALFSRRASRDLFDAHQLLTRIDLNRAKLRLAFVLYGAMNRKDWRTVAIDDVGYDPHELGNELIPVVRAELLAKQTTGSWAEVMIAECRDRLDMVLPLTAGEIAFLDRILDCGEIKLELLTTDSDLVKRIGAHPLLQWKALNVRQHRTTAPQPPDQCCSPLGAVEITGTGIDIMCPRCGKRPTLVPKYIKDPLFPLSTPVPNDLNNTLDDFELPWLGVECP